MPAFSSIARFSASTCALIGSTTSNVFPVRVFTVSVILGTVSVGTGWVVIVAVIDSVGVICVVLVVGLVLNPCSLISTGIWSYVQTSYHNASRGVSVLLLSVYTNLQSTATQLFSSRPTP